MGTKTSAPEPKPLRTWVVRIEMSREFAVLSETGEAAIEEARDLALFDEEFPVDRDDIDEIKASWKDAAGTWHVPGCYANHCAHYDCETDDEEGAEDYHEYCANCDPH